MDLGFALDRRRYCVLDFAVGSRDRQTTLGGDKADYYLFTVSTPPPQKKPSWLKRFSLDQPFLTQVKNAILTPPTFEI